MWFSKVIRDFYAQGHPLAHRTQLWPKYRQCRRRGFYDWVSGAAKWNSLTSLINHFYFIDSSDVSNSLSSSFLGDKISCSFVSSACLTSDGNLISIQLVPHCFCKLILRPFGSSFLRFIESIITLKLSSASRTQINGQHKLKPRVKGQHRYPRVQQSRHGK